MEDSAELDGLPTKGGASRGTPAFVVLRVILAIAVVVFLVLLLRRMDLARVWRTLRAADGQLVLGAVFLNVVVNTGARIQRWRTLLDALPRKGARVGFWSLGSLLLASYAANNLLPGRSGEALRTIGLRDRHGYTVGALVAVQLVEKIVEALSLGLLAVPFIIWTPPSTILTVPLIAFAALGLGGIGLLILLARRPGPAAVLAPVMAPSPSSAREKWRRFVVLLGDGIRLLGPARVWSRALIWSWVSDLTDVAMIALCLHAVQIDLSLAMCFLVFVGVNLAVAVPSTPAQVGVLEAGAVLMLGTLGIASSPALSFALLYHAAHVLPTTMLGAVGLVGQWRSRARGPD